jgi:hypothetical protein
MAFQNFGREGKAEPVDNQVITVASNAAVIFITGGVRGGLGRGRQVAACTGCWVARGACWFKVSPLVGEGGRLLTHPRLEPPPGCQLAALCTRACGSCLPTLYPTLYLTCLPCLLPRCPTQWCWEL